MFYANNEQVKGIFLNGRNYNYLAYGFSKIIPEDRNVYQLYLNLAYKYLNQYRIEFGTVKDGYDNALVCPRFDKPDSNGVFHSPFTYYYGGNIISTKNVPVLITDGNYALRNALVYNDMNINGAINYFATNTDFQGHNVNTYLEEFGSSQSYFDRTVMSNCSNFHLRSLSSFSKGSQPTLYNCNNFSGWFNFVRGDDGTRFPGFIGFLEDCKDGVFNINCKNMHGGGSSANITNYYNFSGIKSCNNIRLNITGSSWQVWPHDHSFSSNCNINTYNVIPGFGYMNYCNFNVELPKDSKPEMTSGFAFLNNANNCNYNLNALDSNLFNYRSVGYVPLFENLNNSNLNLQVNNAVEFGDSLGGNLHNCNIVFDNIKGNLIDHSGWNHIYNCNITGNVEAATTRYSFIDYGDGLNININAAKSSRILPMYGCNNVNGNLVAGDMTQIYYSNYLNLNVSGGGLNLINIEHSRFNLNGTNTYPVSINNCKFEIYNCNDFAVNSVSSSNFNLYNAVGNAILKNLNNVKFVERFGANYTITNLDNCLNSWIYADTVEGTIENVYNTKLGLKSNNATFATWRVDNCEIAGFPYRVAYTTNCTFNVPLRVAFGNSSYVTWNNVWPHRTPTEVGSGWSSSYLTKAGLRSVDNFSGCYLTCNDGIFGGSVTFNNINNMQTDIKNFYSGTVTANLPDYNMNIKLNVDCKTLNLGMFQAGPPHGFQNATISANDIYAKGNMPSAYIQVNCDTKIYCENYCNVCFRPYVSNINSVLQPVVLINNYGHYNTGNQRFYGGLTRIGSLSTRTGPRSLFLYSGACVFINNAVLGNVIVDNSLLFVGSNVRFVNTLNVNVSNGGLIVGKLNWSSHASEIQSRIGRGHLAWNIWDYGPWGKQSLFDYCINV